VTSWLLLWVLCGGGPPLQVLRGGESGLLELGMVPKPWHGKGLLGCHLSRHV
jgi:hypothetical protein